MPTLGWIGQLHAVAMTAGALFVRSYERGERVYVAMLARGYGGAMVLDPVGASRGTAASWTRALVGPAAGHAGVHRRDRGSLVSASVGRAQAAMASAGAGENTGTEHGDDTVLDVRDLAFAYPDGRQVLFGVNLSVTRGERVAILGPNGAGKTTLVLHLNGVLGVGGNAAGSVTVDGLTVSTSTLREIRRRVGIVFQDPDDQLFTPTVWDDIAFGPANLGLRDGELTARVERALGAVGMTEFARRPPHHLSFGQRRRVAAATVLSMDPSLLVLDEPSSNLDPAARREFADIVQALGLTTLMVTHDLLYALQLCPRSVIMNGGRIVADGPTAEILADAELLAANRLELPFGYALPG